MKGWQAGLLAVFAFVVGLFFKSRKGVKKSLVETQEEIAETASEQAEAAKDAADEAHAAVVKETKKKAVSIDRADRSKLADMVRRVFGGGS